jgi:L-threonylcarbamoyladenylate synthase
MTLILKRSDLAKDFITGNQETVGLRVPDQTIALSLLQEFKKLGGSGIAAPSANRFGAVSPTTAVAVSQELSEYMESQDLILDGGSCSVGIESTIIDCTSAAPRILRPGAITEEMIAEIVDLEIGDQETVQEIRVSGALDSHYAPKAKVILDIEPVAGDAYLAPSEFETPEGVLRIGAPKSDEEFARLLYDAFRSADEGQVKRIVVRQPVGEGIAEAIRDRLMRAAD